MNDKTNEMISIKTFNKNFNNNKCRSLKRLEYTIVVLKTQKYVL